MAYADFMFYSTTYFGDDLTESNAEKWLSRAGDTIDSFTFNRLTSSFPTIEAHAVKVKKAVCAVAEALYRIDTQRKSVAVQPASDGSYRGVISSMTSGKESVSYAVGTAAASVYANAVADDSVKNKLLYNIAVQYLTDIPDSNGINLLYAG